MTVAELKELLNTYPDDLEIVVLSVPKEFRKPYLRIIPVISCITEGGAKYYFDNDWEVLEGEKREEVLLIT